MDNRTGKRRIGDQGEEFVARNYLSKGFEILERNYLRKWGELDIVAEKESVLHFIEVKTVSREMNHRFVNHETSDEYRPEDNVHQYKLHRLRRIIQTYLEERGLSTYDDIEWQFDLAVVYISGSQYEIQIEEDLII